MELYLYSPCQTIIRYMDLETLVNFFQTGRSALPFLKSLPQNMAQDVLKKLWEIKFPFHHLLPEYQSLMDPELIEAIILSHRYEIIFRLDMSALHHWVWIDILSHAVKLDDPILMSHVITRPGEVYPWPLFSERCLNYPPIMRILITRGVKLS